MCFIVFHCVLCSLYSFLNIMAICQVCQVLKPTSTINFGADVCESCRAFFRNNWARVDLKCRGGAYSCEISPTSRACMACRMAKCRAAGMEFTTERRSREAREAGIRAAATAATSAYEAAADAVLSTTCEEYEVYHLLKCYAASQNDKLSYPAWTALRTSVYRKAAG